jgi:hypothetical protein
MSSLKRFTKPKILRGLGLPLLGRFFERFTNALSEKKVILPALPPEGAAPEAVEGYFTELANLFLSPKDLPEDMTRALYGVVEMANDQGEERLTKAVAERNLDLKWEEKASHLDIAMQVWLADAALFEAKHREQQLYALTSFQYFGTKTPPASRLPFTKPTEMEMLGLTRAVDEWCAKNHRGKDVAEISMYHLDDEWWFLVHHGGTITRATTVEPKKRGLLHYRPERDDVVVYNPGRDEIRIHAASNPERAVYQEQFGKYLRGDEQYFSERKGYTLEPLREDLGRALEAEGLAGIKGIVLQELEVRYGGPLEDSVTYQSKDMVMSAARRNKPDKQRKAVPDSGILVRAKFELLFTDSEKPRTVHVRPPNMLRLSRHCDAQAVQDWLTRRNFREGPPVAGKGDA